MLNEAGLEPDDDEGYGEFINCINKMWNNTRMIVNLSFLPCLSIKSIL